MGHEHADPAAPADSATPASDPAVPIPQAPTGHKH